jgi:hypothetical protein
MGNKVWVAVYNHRHGEDMRAFDTEVKALKWREEIADEYWEEMAMRLGDYETFHFDHVEIE